MKSSSMTSPRSSGLSDILRSSYVADVTMPKLWPAPRMAQNKSGFEVLETWSRRPSAVTRRTDKRASMAKPYFPVKRPMPPPRVTPSWPGHEQVLCSTFDIVVVSHLFFFFSSSRFCSASPVAFDLVFTLVVRPNHNFRCKLGERLTHFESSIIDWV